MGRGYDIDQITSDDILTEFDNKIGLKCLKAIHLNDNQNPIDSHAKTQTCKN